MMAASIPLAIAPRVGALLRLLGSDVDGEALGAARALRRTLGGVGLDLHALADAVERPPAPTGVYRDRPATGDAPEWARPTRPTHHRPKLGDVMLDFGRRCEVVAALRRGLSGSALTAWEVEFSVSLIGRLNSGNGRMTQRQAETLSRLLGKLGGSRF